MSSFLGEVFSTFIGFLYAPVIFPQMFWILIPMVLAILLMEAYFSRYPRESIGHHKSLENTIFLVFLSIDLVRYVVMNHSLGSPKFIATILFFGFCIAVAVMDFMHKLPLSLFFRVS